MFFRLKTEENLKARALKDVDKLESAVAKNKLESAATSKMMLDKSESVLQLRGEVHTITFHLNPELIVLQVKALSKEVKRLTSEVAFFKSEANSATTALSALQSAPTKPVMHIMLGAQLRLLESEALRLKSGVKLGETEADLNLDIKRANKVCTLSCPYAMLSLCYP
jgi:hypothetical protein